MYEVLVKVKIDPTKYTDVAQSPIGALDLVRAMIEGEVDWPTVNIECQGRKEQVEGNDEGDIEEEGEDE